MNKQRWLITGAGGQLGGHVCAALARSDQRPQALGVVRAAPCGALGTPAAHCELTDSDALRGVVRAFRPTHILHAAALSAVGDCHREPALAQRVNAGATRVLAELADEWTARLVYVSTDMVFDGAAAPYRETDAPAPLSAYGRSKLAGESAALEAPRALVVRPPLMYGFPRTARETTFSKQMAALRCGAPLTLFTDEFRTPLWLADAARALLALCASDLAGLIHLAGPQRLSRFELIEQCARVLGISRPNLVPISRLDVEAPEPRPADLSLDAARFLRFAPELAPGRVRAEVFEPMACA